MSNKTNDEIDVSEAEITALAGTAISECYGVVGMTVERFSDGLNYVLDKENYSKGVIVRSKQNGIEIELHVIIADGTKAVEVVKIIQKRVKYSLEKALNMHINRIDVFVEGIKETK